MGWIYYPQGAHAVDTLNGKTDDFLLNIQILFLVLSLYGFVCQAIGFILKQTKAAGSKSLRLFCFFGLKVFE